MKTVLEVLNLSTEFLTKKGIINARRQAEDLLSSALNISRLQLYTEFDRPLSEKELELCRNYVTRRGQREPSGYIHGEVEFYNGTFYIDKNVLIPRQETELLVDRIVKDLEKIDRKGKRFVDLCSGSGCIGISVKKQFPDLAVTLSDLSKEALAVAKKNADRNGVDVQFLQGDLLAPLTDIEIDFLACNPPYISELEFELLEPEVRKFEPSIALLAGASGIEFYQRLASDLKNHLTPHAKVWMELGTGQGPAVVNFFKNAGFPHCHYEKDFAGHDRFFFLENE